jgi:hypothetical protein
MGCRAAGGQVPQHDLCRTVTTCSTPPQACTCCDVAKLGLPTLPDPRLPSSTQPCCMLTDLELPVVYCCYRGACLQL